MIVLRDMIINPKNVTYIIRKENKIRIDFLKGHAVIKYSSNYQRDTDYAWLEKFFKGKKEQ